MESLYEIYNTYIMHGHISRNFINSFDEHIIIIPYNIYKLSINQTELNSPYTDWLVSWLREIIQKPDQNILETTYLENHRLLSFAERELILGQLESDIRTLTDEFNNLMHERMGVGKKSISKGVNRTLIASLLDASRQIETKVNNQFALSENIVRILLK